MAQPRIADIQEKPAEGLDPIVGTWTLDHAQSQVPTMAGVPRVKDQTESYQDAHGRIELRLVRVLEDGAQVVGRLTWPTGGGIVQVLEGPVSPGESYVETRVAAGDWLVFDAMITRGFSSGEAIAAVISRPPKGAAG